MSPTLRKLSRRMGGGAVTAAPAWASERSLLLDGVDEQADFGVLPAGANFTGNDPFWFRFWIKPTSFPSFKMLFGKYSGFLGSGWGIGIGAFSVGQMATYLCDASGYNGSTHNIARNTGAVSSDACLVVNVWQHVIMQYTAATKLSADVEYYVNDAFVVSRQNDGAQIQSSMANAGTFQLGTSRFSPSFAPAGTDGVLIGTGILTAGQRTALYSAITDPSTLSSYSNGVTYIPFLNADSIPSIAELKGGGTGAGVNMEAGDLTTDVPT